MTGLRREDFEVYENDQLQEVSTFAAGEFPLTMALGVDRSWSMAGDPLRMAKRWIDWLLHQAGKRSLSSQTEPIATAARPPRRSWNAPAAATR